MKLKLGLPLQAPPPDNGSVFIFIQQVDEVGGHMEVKLSQVEVVALWLARSVLRLVLELELKVLSFCLLRWGREMEEEIASLQANLPDIEARIKGVPAAARLLPSHHDGAQGRHPAGHYWAYVHYR